MAPLYPNDVLTPAFLTGVIDERPDVAASAQRRQYIGSEFFPYKEVYARHLAWDKTANENNLAGFYGNKARAIVGQDISFGSAFADLQDILASRSLDADIIDVMRDPGMSYLFTNEGNAPFVVKAAKARFLDHLQKRIAWCDDALAAQEEYMQMQALQGTLTWPPVDANGAAIPNPMPHWNYKQLISLAFPLLAEFQQAATTLTGHNARPGTGVAWNAVGSNIIQDLEVISQYMLNFRGVPTQNLEAIMSSNILSYQAFNTTFLQWVRGAFYTDVNERLWDVPAIKKVLETKLGFSIRTYDAMWTYWEDPDAAPTGISYAKFLPEGTVIIHPKGQPLGYMANMYHVDGSGNFVFGRYGWSHTDDEPPIETRVGFGKVAFPIMEHPETIFVLDAYH